MRSSPFRYLAGRLKGGIGPRPRSQLEPSPDNNQTAHRALRVIKIAKHRGSCRTGENTGRRGRSVHVRRPAPPPRRSGTKPAHRRETSPHGRKGARRRRGYLVLDRRAPVRAHAGSLSPWRYLDKPSNKRRMALGWSWSPSDQRDRLTGAGACVSCLCHPRPP